MSDIRYWVVSSRETVHVNQREWKRASIDPSLLSLPCLSLYKKYKIFSPFSTFSPVVFVISACRGLIFLFVNKIYFFVCLEPINKSEKLCGVSHM